MKAINRKENEMEVSVDISSLIDVSFLLLIYFLVTSLIAKPELDLRAALPSDIPSPEKRVPEVVRVSLDEQGKVALFGKVTDVAGAGRELPGLLAELERLVLVRRHMGEGISVVLQAHDEARHQQLVDVMNTFHKAGIQTVLIEP
jgi:biopolymer transport protein ExbD